jgi:hypothetical protein
MASDTRGTIKLPREPYERHNERRADMGLSWTEYIDAEAPEIADTLRRVVREELDQQPDEPSGDSQNNQDTEGEISEEGVRAIVREELNPINEKLIGIEEAIGTADRGY